jgi:hypothetical protein
MANEEELVHLQQGIARSASDEGPQQRAVMTLVERLQDLIAIERLRRQVQSEEVLAELTARVDAYTDRGSAASVLDELVELVS